MSAPGRSEQSAAYAALLGRDPVLAGLAERHGRPDPFAWPNDRTGNSNFAALLYGIAGQQISTAAALAIYNRLRAAVGGGTPDPDGILALGPARLRSVGLSRAKVAYMTDLAEKQGSGALDVDNLEGLDDARAVAALTAVRGIGQWSAEMFLILQLHRPDVLPAGDLGIRRAVEHAWHRPELPTIKDVRQRGESWAPQRTYAAALLWASLARG